MRRAILLASCIAGLYGLGAAVGVGLFVFPFLFPPPPAMETLAEAERARHPSVVI
jgi:hypothetical protein